MFLLLRYSSKAKHTMFQKESCSYQDNCGNFSSCTSQLSTNPLNLVNHALHIFPILQDVFQNQIQCFNPHFPVNHLRSPTSSQLWDVSPTNNVVGTSNSNNSHHNQLQHPLILRGAHIHCPVRHLHFPTNSQLQDVSPINNAVETSGNSTCSIS